jgi:hypothetical protein
MELLEEKIDKINKLFDIFKINIKKKHILEDKFTIKLKCFYDNLNTIDENLLELINDLNLDDTNIIISQNLKNELKDQKEINNKLKKISPLLLYLFLNS